MIKEKAELPDCMYGNWYIFIEVRGVEDNVRTFLPKCATKATLGIDTRINL